MKKLGLIFAVLIGLCVTGCEKEPDTSPKKPTGQGTAAAPAK